MIILLLAVIYLSFISLGLPDSILGSAWPLMHVELNVPLSFAGIISMIITISTIVSSLFSDYINKKMGSGLVTAISVSLTAISLFLFSITNNFYLLCLIAIPYGLGAGSVDASLNNYVALHFQSRHMSWLHAMWGVGASLGPTIMGYAISNNYGWNKGYLFISIIQIILSFLIFLSLPLWKKQNEQNEEEKIDNKPLSFKQVFSIIGVKEVLITFFCYCALEQTAILWSGTFLSSLNNEIDAISLSSLFFIGITGGRFINGFLTAKFSDQQLIRIGQGIILFGIVLICLQFNIYIVYLGLFLIGLGCAPIYPCIIHSTPIYFGKENSQALIGIQMASAYLGVVIVPPIFGLIADFIDSKLLPLFLFIILILMIIMHEILIKKKNRVK